MPHYIVAKCPQCDKDVPLADAPTSEVHLDPNKFFSVTCTHCGNKFSGLASELQVLTTTESAPPPVE
jgi:endogenous inhibitor of DNA gyrase (YacG/DUF329 family)